VSENGRVLIVEEANYMFHPNMAYPEVPLEVGNRKDAYLAKYLGESVIGQVYPDELVLTNF
jgi:hypothetical protein